MASSEIKTWTIENKIEVMNVTGSRANKKKASLYFATIFKIEKAMLVTMHVIENNKIIHSEIIFFTFISSSVAEEAEFHIKQTAL